MTVLVVTLLAQAGGRLSGFATQLVERTGRSAPVLVGVLVAQGVLAAGAVLLGIALAPQVTPETRTLLLAIALALVGIGLTGGLGVSRAGAGSPFGWPRLGALGTALFGGGAILSADSGLLLIAAAAAHSPLPWAAWPGAVLGLLGALMPPLLLGEREWRRMPWRAIRSVAGVVLILAAIVVALATKGLI